MVFNVPNYVFSFHTIYLTLGPDVTGLSVAVKIPRAERRSRVRCVTCSGSDAAGSLWVWGTVRRFVLTVRTRVHSHEEKEKNKIKYVHHLHPMDFTHTRPRCGDPGGLDAAAAPLPSCRVAPPPSATRGSHATRRGGGAPSGGAAARRSQGGTPGSQSFSGISRRNKWWIYAVFEWTHNKKCKKKIKKKKKANDVE